MSTTRATRTPTQLGQKILDAIHANKYRSLTAFARAIDTDLTTVRRCVFEANANPQAGTCARFVAGGVPKALMDALKHS